MSDEINKIVPEPAEETAAEAAEAVADAAEETAEAVAEAAEETAEAAAETAEETVDEVAETAEEAAEAAAETAEAAADTAEETAGAAAAEAAALNDELEQLRDTFQAELDKASEEAKAAEEMQPVIQELEDGPDPEEEEDEADGEAEADEPGDAKKAKKKKKKAGKKRPVGLIVALVLVCVLIVAPLLAYFVLSVKEPNLNAFVSAYAAAESAKDPAEQSSKYTEALSYCTEGSVFEGQKQLILEKIVAATCQSSGYAAAKSYAESNMDDEMRASPKTRAFKNFLEIPEKLDPAFNALPEKLPAAIEAAGSAADVDYEALAKDLDVPEIARAEAGEKMKALGEAWAAANTAETDDAFYNAMRDYLTAYQDAAALGITAQKIPEDIIVRMYDKGYAYEASMVIDQIFTDEMLATVESEAVKTAVNDIAALKSSGTDIWAFALAQREAGKTEESDLIAAADAAMPENCKKAVARYAGELILALDAQENDSNLTLARRHLANVVAAEDALALPVTDTAIRLCRVLLASGDVSNAYTYMMRYLLATDAATAEGEEGESDATAAAEAQLFAQYPDFESDYYEIASLYNAQNAVEEVFSEAYYTAAYGGGAFDTAATKDALDAVLTESGEKYAPAYVNYYKYVCEIYGDMNKDNMLAHVLAAETAFGAHRVICLADKAQIYLSLGKNDAAFSAAMDMLAVDSGSDLANALMAKQQRMEDNPAGAMEYAQRGIDASGDGAASSCEEEAAIYELLAEKYADAYARVKALYAAARTNGTLTVENVELAMVIANKYKSADDAEQAEIDAFAAELSDLLTQSGREPSANTQALLDGTKLPGDVYLGAAVTEKTE